MLIANLRYMITHRIHINHQKSWLGRHPDTWHLSPDSWLLTPKTWHLTPDTWHFVWLRFVIFFNLIVPVLLPAHVKRFSVSREIFLACSGPAFRVSSGHLLYAIFLCTGSYVFTESAHKLNWSISRFVHLYVCLSHPGKGASQWTRDLWLKCLWLI